MTSTSIQAQISDLTLEISMIRQMSEQEVCLKYNVDEKQEIITLIREEIDGLQADYERMSYIEEREEELDRESILLAYRNPLRQLLINI